MATSPFARFDDGLAPPSPRRAAVTAMTRRPERECVRALLGPAALAPAEEARAAALARDLALRLRAKKRPGGVEGLVHEYSLSSQEGVALMCLAEALLRIPDPATRDALIRDKIARGDWWSHLGKSPSLFVNAATWGLVVTGKLTATADEGSLSSALARLVARGGEPIIRRAVDIAMRLMGEQFVIGETIEEALANARPLAARGFRHSFDMLGEAATTAEDAARYLAAYRAAIEAIGAATGGLGVVEGPGISIKLSALHPRYARAKRGRVLAELLPRLKGLALLSRRHDIGLNIDAEEADRLELSLDLFEALALDPDLAGWDGLGFVVQAYGKRCPAAIDWLIDLARRARRRFMVRLVKGAYWDSEIKRAQVDGLEDFPVFTRKAHTDVSYLACARKLLAAPDAVYPQFATHNARTLAAIVAMAGEAAPPDAYEFQCLHGMGEALYEEVVGPEKLARPCRVYAPVGTHETLLAYLVRRLLENGANTSFVNRLADPAIAVETLIEDPVALVAGGPDPGAPHERIAAPPALLGPSRVNSRGLDLADDARLARLHAGLAESAAIAWTAAPAGAPPGSGEPVRDPADTASIVGRARFATPAEIEAALARAAAFAEPYARAPTAERAATLRRAADALEARMAVLIGLICREAGKTMANAVGEVREAVDFLRFYAAEAEHLALDDPARAPPGPVVCISPWNFPLAIFVGQVAAALAVGAPVLAKPAEETPLVAAEAVRLLHAAGVPEDALHVLPGAGEVGAALVADARVAAVLFTGSTEVARIIQRSLARRLTPEGAPPLLVAETGGQNAMIVDSSALAEQVVLDALASAFDSAGQRCSALRLLCLQDDVADRILAMLRGAMAELEVGSPTRLSTDIGPVISAEARATIEAHVAAMAARGHRVHRAPIAPDTHGFFVAPTLIEIDRVSDLGREVFGPVLHVLRYRRDELDRLVDAIGATGYALAFGLHTRIDETIARVLARVEAGNVYVNRTTIGAVVGVQPFGGSGLSGTGPKAGGPLTLVRLAGLPTPADLVGRAPPEAEAYAAWLADQGHAEDAARVRALAARSPAGHARDLPGPVGERNRYALRPRRRVGLLAEAPGAIRVAFGAVLVAASNAIVERGALARAGLGALPPTLAARVETVERLDAGHGASLVIADGVGPALRALAERVAAWDGPVVPLVLPRQVERDPTWLQDEVTVTTNTAAAGGNASLMTIG